MRQAVLPNLWKMWGATHPTVQLTVFDLFAVDADELEDIANGADWNPRSLRTLFLESSDFLLFFSSRQSIMHLGTINFVSSLYNRLKLRDTVYQQI